uniref:Cirhin n=1 Tax=Knipowitschia caucasica TaxID=637954 RepID=A0AAV2L6E2_KNICA
MGEFKVHRVRFFDYMPSGIRALAFNRDTERLAVARDQGSLEIFNFSDNYCQEKIFPGRDGRSIEALCWVGTRLFSVGLDGLITEYDLENLRPKYAVEAYGGPVWSISCNLQGNLLAVGCEDGTVKIFEVLDDGIQFQRNLDRQKGRIISVSWHPSGTKIAAGMMDMVRVFDAETGRAALRLLVERGVGAAKNKEVVVWSLAFLSDNTIVSGDSAGKVQIWDGLMGTLVRSHFITKWDVLALSVASDESSLIAGTSEGLVVQFQFLQSSGEQQDRQWVRTRTFKNHSHDVHALVLTDTAVVSGGMDTQLVVRPLLDKVEKNTSESELRKIIFPLKSLVSCAKKAGLLLFQFPGHLEVWRLGESEGYGKDGDRLSVKRKPEKLIHLKRKGEDHISCSALSPCGTWLAYSTVSCVRLYRLQQSGNNISITKQPVHLLAPSEDGKWLATANTDNEVHVYNLKKLKLHCTVPVYDSSPTAIAIHPMSSNLVIGHADKQVFEYSLGQKEYTLTWSRKLQKQGLHPHWFERDTPISHISFNPQKPSHILLNDAYMLCIIDQSLPLPDHKTRLCNQNTLRGLPESERVQHSHAFKICKRFQDVLSVSFQEDESLVIVERPLLDILSQLPAPVRQKKFAT